MNYYNELIKALQNTLIRVKSNPELAAQVPPYQLNAAIDAIQQLINRVGGLEHYIYEALDALDRGADNDWAREALEAAVISSEEEEGKT